MTGQLTVDGYTFDNPPDEFDKNIDLSNTAVPHFRRFTADFYQSDSQDVTFTVKGDLSLSEQSDLSELETLQQKAIEGGEVTVDFDPFFAGKGVITDNPFRQEDNRARYNFTFSINEVQTDPTGFPAHATPTTGNTFELGSFDFGFDPDSVRQSYERQTAKVETLEGLNRTADNAGLVPKVEVSGQIDGAGAQALWDKARNNELSYLSAEFQNGWSLVTKLLVSHDPNTPDFVTGLYRYTVEFLIVKDPQGGIGQVSSFIDHDTRDLGTYTADSSSGDADAGSTSFGVSGGTVDLQGNSTAFDGATVEVQLGQTNYVYVADPDADQNGQVRVNQSAFPQSDGRLYTVETDDNGITNVIDERAQDTSGGGNTVGSIGFTVEAGSDDDTGVSWSKTVLELDPSTTNYVYADGSTGAVSYNTSGFPSGDVELYEVQTDATSVDVVIDQRAATTTGGDDELDTINYDVSGGTGSIDDAYVQWDETTVELRYNRENYVFVTDDNGDGQGQVEVNQSNVPQDALGLWKVTTDDSGITDEEDLRDSLIDEGDGSTSDLSFSDRPSISDGQFNFSRVMALGTDTVGDPALSQDYLGLAALSESVPDPSDPLTAQGSTAFTDSVLVEDGGSATGVSGASEATLNWGSAADWDAGDGSRVVHADFAGGDRNAGTVQLGYSPDLSDLTLYWPLDEKSGTTADGVATGNDGDIDGVNYDRTGPLSSGALEFQGNASSWVRLQGYNNHPTDAWTVAFFIRTTDNNDRAAISSYADTDSEDNAKLFYVPSSVQNYVFSNSDDSGVDLTDGNLHLVVIRWRSSDGKWTLHLDGTQEYSGNTGSGLTYGGGGTLYLAQEQDGFDDLDGTQAMVGDMADYMEFDTYKSDSFVQGLWQATQDGSLTTAWKSYDGGANVGNMTLENVQSTLNGQNATVYVESDSTGDGSVNETSDPISLDGSGGPYTVTGLTTSAESFRLRIELSTTDMTVTPKVSNFDLVAPVSGGSDSDQNPQTDWELQPGIYERSGNEYEGGGMTARYGAD